MQNYENGHNPWTVWTILKKKKKKKKKKIAYQQDLAKGLAKCFEFMI